MKLILISFFLLVMLVKGGGALDQLSVSYFLKWCVQAMSMYLPRNPDKQGTFW